MTTPLHLLAYALYPKYYHSKFFFYQVEQPQTRILKWYIQGYKTTLRKIYRDVGIAMGVCEEFGACV
jgi:hypothetical protein